MHFLVHYAEGILRALIALVGGPAAPHRGLRVVLGRPLAVGVHHTEARLGRVNSLISQGAQEAHRRGVIAALICRYAFDEWVRRAIPGLILSGNDLVRGLRG
jgi:hypothetical protein